MKLWRVWADQRDLALLSHCEVFSLVLLMASCPSRYGTWSERSVFWQGVRRVWLEIFGCIQLWFSMFSTHATTQIKACTIMRPGKDVMQGAKTSAMRGSAKEIEN